ncbi:MAG: hypothetical protein VKJ27_03070 [Synechocystis sp.]|nr:hypothetical protein [Synechocystis sp.]
MITKSFSRSSLALLSGLVAAKVFVMAGEIKGQPTVVTVNITDICQLDTDPDATLPTPTPATTLSGIDLSGLTAMTASSAGELSQANAPDTIPYTLTVNGTGFNGITDANMTATPEVATTGNAFSAACANTCNGSFTVNVTNPSADVLYGTYQDTITWTFTPGT